MPAGAVASPPWVSGSWLDTAWEENTWGIGAPAPDQIFISSEAICVARVGNEAMIGATVSGEVLLVARVVNEALVDAE